MGPINPERRLVGIQSKRRVIRCRGSAKLKSGMHSKFAESSERVQVAGGAAIRQAASPAWPGSGRPARESDDRNPPEDAGQPAGETFHTNEIMTATREQVTAYINTVRAVADAIRELKQVPAGHLYAQVMGMMSEDAFERIIGTLTGAGLVARDQSHLLRWVGPAS